MQYMRRDISFFHEMDLEKSSIYQKTLCKGIENLKNYDIMENRDYQQTFYCICSEKFISPYQCHVYIDMDNIDYSADLDYSLLKEYFAEGYRAYFYEPDVLKNRDVDLFNYIKDLVNEDG